MKLRNPLTISVVVILGALVALGACDDSDEPVGRAIPTLNATEASPGNGPDVVTVAGEPLNAECACEEWSCAISDCGYDPPTHPYGACCLVCVTGGDPVPKPSCEGGPSPCSSYPNSAEYGVDICEPGDEPYGYGCQVCPSAFTCCYGGHYGDPPL